MNIILSCYGCKKTISVPRFRYRYRIKRNPNYKPYCSYRCANPIHTNDPTKKYCCKCKSIKLKNEFYFAKDRYDKLTGFCKGCNKISDEKRYEKYPDHKKNYHRARRLKLKIKLFQILDATKCTYCETRIWQALQFEHKTGLGAQDKVRFKDQDTFLNYYISHPHEARKNLQICCANCNWIKRFAYEEYKRLDKRTQQYLIQGNLKGVIV